MPLADKNAIVLDGERALVTALDFLTPVVDDPYVYGRIAATSALGHVYAMGATPLCALAIAAFPEDLDAGVIASILRGGVDTCAEAGIAIVGGHTIKDAEPKYGLSVTGIVRPDRIVRCDAGYPGDVLILTKPLGTGILTTARHDDAIGPDELEPAIESMLELDRAASEAALRHGVRAMTRVAGYGLIGHLREMLAEGMGARIDGGAVPIFPRALALAAHDATPSGTRANLRDARANGARFSTELPLGLRAVLCDVQTSGGLLMAAGFDRAEALLAELRTFAGAARAIGTLTREGGIEVDWRPAKQ